MKVLSLAIAVLAFGLGGCTITTQAPPKASEQASVPAHTGTEGILIVDSASLPNTTLYAGQTNVEVMPLRLTAKLSDMDAQRVQVDLGTNKAVYTKVFRALYLADPSGRIIASAELNDNTVVKAGNDYILVLGGFSYTVPKDTTQTLTLRADLYPTIKDIDQSARTFAIPANGVRAVDKAGIDQYGPTMMIAQTVVVASPIADFARIVISPALDNFPASEAVAAAGPNNDSYDKFPLLRVHLFADKDYIHIARFKATVGKTEGPAVATAAYLYDGTRLIGSASVNANNGTALFEGLDVAIAPDSVRDLTVKADIRAASSVPTSFFAMVASDGVIAENSSGSKVETVGAVAGNQFKVRNAGPVFQLVEAPAKKMPSMFDSSVVTATFWLKIQAVGGDVCFDAGGGTCPFTFDVYRNGVPIRNVVYRSVANWGPSADSKIDAVRMKNGGLIVLQNHEVTVPVFFTFVGRDHSGVPFPPGLYTIGLQQVRWSFSGGSFADAHWKLENSSFMSGQSGWMSSVVSLP